MSTSDRRAGSPEVAGSARPPGLPIRGSGCGKAGMSSPLYLNRVGGAGCPLPLPGLTTRGSHHRTCGSASGGSLGNIQSVVESGECAQTLCLPGGIAQDHVNHRCVRLCHGLLPVAPKAARLRGKPGDINSCQRIAPRFHRFQKSCVSRP